VLPSLARKVDVFVVDAPRVARVALGAARADAESTYVLCRHLDETSSDFMHRVQRRIQRISGTCCIRSLCYVIGPEAACGRSAVPLLEQLMPLLGAGASLSVAGPGSHRDIVFEWIDALQRRRTHVAVRARLYNDGHEVSVFARPVRGVASREPAEHPAASRPHAAVARAAGWFPKEPATGYLLPDAGLPHGS
jgi:hypothetical protein